MKYVFYLTKRNYFQTQRGKIIQNARKMPNITYSVIVKNCSKLLIDNKKIYERF